MNKKALSVLVILTMLLIMLPVYGMAVGDPVEYDIWVGGTRITSANVGTLPAGVSYEHGTATLTLSDANITTTMASPISIASGATVNITLIGTNILTTNGENFAGLNVPEGATVTISGSGSLTAFGGKQAAGIGGNYGEAGGTINISGGTIKANGGDPGSGGEASGSYGIAGNNITISAGTVIAKGYDKGIRFDTFNSADYHQISFTASDSYWGTNLSAIDYDDIDNYIYLEIAPAVAEIGSVGYSTLQYAINAVTEGQTIKMLADITSNQLEPNTIIESSNVSFTLDLNGKKLRHNNSSPVRHRGTGTLTIQDTGTGGAIVGNWDTATTIIVSGSGTINLLSGNVEVGTSGVDGSTAITVSNSSANIQGGTVVNKGSGLAVYANSQAEVIISDNAQIIGRNTADNKGTIRLHQNNTLTLKGGIIFNENGGKAITVSDSSNTINVSDIPSGKSVIVKGGTAITQAPNIIGGISTTASTNYDGTSPVAYNASDISTYKYLKFDPVNALTGTSTISNTSPRIGDAIVGSLIGGNNTGTLSYVWKADGTEVGTGASYTVVSADLGKTITLEITSSVETGTVTSLATSAVISNLTPGGGGSSDSDSSPAPTTNPVEVIITPPAADRPTAPTQGEIRVPASMGNNGSGTVQITNEILNHAFDRTLENARRNGNEGNGIALILRVDTGNSNLSNILVNLPKTVQDAIIERQIINTIVVVQNPDIRIGMDLNTVRQINNQANTDVNITANRRDNTNLPEEARDAVGNRPVFDLRVNYGSTGRVQNFGDGSVTVTIPYTLGPNEKPENVQAVYVDEDGKLHWLPNSVYDSVEKVVRFSTSHFSIYGVGYKEEAPVLTDISTHWAKNDIDFVINKGLLVGTSPTTFGPNTGMTRGMFVTVLGRLAEADVDAYKTSSFTDVKSDAYYMSSVEWAKEKGIVSGMGEGRFAPEQTITREQMAAIILNYADFIDIKLPKVNAEKTFADNDKISSYAKDSVSQVQMAGVIGGKNGNVFDPQGTATRAEFSSVLRRFVELVEATK